MKNIFNIKGFIALFFLFPNYALANTNRWTCVNKNNGNFTTVYEVGTGLRKSITHISSYDPVRDREYEGSSSHKIIFFDNNKIVATSSSSMQPLINFYVFNLNKKIYTQSGHYLSNLRVPNAQLFKCY
tara:strand:+ start:193 stop:576 length:384 start_codon:yes stop_codon:yes gene_type:complete